MQVEPGAPSSSSLNCISVRPFVGLPSTADDLVALPETRRRGRRVSVNAPEIETIGKCYRRHADGARLARPGFQSFPARRSPPSPSPRRARSGQGPGSGCRRRWPAWSCRGSWRGSCRGSSRHRATSGAILAAASNSPTTLSKSDGVFAFSMASIPASRCFFAASGMPCWAQAGAAQSRSAIIISRIFVPILVFPFPSGVFSFTAMSLIVTGSPFPPPDAPAVSLLGARLRVVEALQFVFRLVDLFRGLAVFFLGLFEGLFRLGQQGRPSPASPSGRLVLRLFFSRLSTSALFFSAVAFASSLFPYRVAMRGSIRICSSIRRTLSSSTIATPCGMGTAGDCPAWHAGTDLPSRAAME